MKYISKGMVIKASTEELLFVTRHGADFQLTGLQADGKSRKAHDHQFSIDPSFS